MQPYRAPPTRSSNERCSSGRQRSWQCHDGQDSILTSSIAVGDSTTYGVALAAGSVMATAVWRTTAQRWQLSLLRWHVKGDQSQRTTPTSNHAAFCHKCSLSLSLGTRIKYYVPDFVFTPIVVLSKPTRGDITLNLYPFFVRVLPLEFKVNC